MQILSSSHYVRHIRHDNRAPFLSEFDIIGDDIHSPIVDQTDTFRILTIRDKTYSVRRKWLSSVVCCDQHYTFVDYKIDFLMQSFRQFSALIISSDSLDRTKNIVREVRRILPSKCIVVVTQYDDRIANLQLLRLGVSEILNCKMIPTEGIIRLRTIDKRIRLCRDALLDDNRTHRNEEDRFRLLCKTDITRAERNILKQLLSRSGGVVPFYILADDTRGSRDLEHKLRNLYVKIFDLRRKLAPGVNIETVRGVGYKLTRTPLSGEEKNQTEFPMADLVEIPSQ